MPTITPTPVAPATVDLGLRAGADDMAGLELAEPGL